jgi:ParB-like chromosome segregation protein Spo0J
MQKWPADKVERRKIDALIPYARNARTHSDEQVAQIAASIREWGWTVPILVDEDGGIIAGHGRVLAARKLGLDDAPVMVAEGWSEAQKRAYVLADNKLALNAGWAEELLKFELQELHQMGFDVELTGFDGDELGRLMFEPEFEPGSEDDQGKLDELAPKMVKCPHCETLFDSRGHEQG